MSSEPRLKIAIIGAGVAGAALGQALFKLPHLDVQVYESAPALKEGGHAVGLGINAQRALARLGPDFKSAPSRAGGVESNASIVYVGEGPDAGKEISDVGGDKKYDDGVFEIIVIRSKLLSAIMDGAPEQRFHTGKKLDNVKRLPTGQLEISFVDGQKDTVDALIGADGIHGSVRGLVLGETDPATKPVFTGWWNVFTLAPIEKAVEELGSQYVDPNDCKQHDWIGDGRFILHDITGDKQTAQVIACARTDEDWPEGEWRRLIPREQIARIFEPMKQGRGVVNLLGDAPEVQVLPVFEHLAARTYSAGNLTLIGDAAHTMSPWQASGAGTTIEDVLFLSTLLQHTKSIDELSVAFQVYDQARRPRTQAITKSSKEVGLTITGRNPHVGLEAAKIQKFLHGKWDFIHEYDMDAHLKETLEQYKQRVQTNS